MHWCRFFCGIMFVSMLTGSIYAGDFFDEPADVAPADTSKVAADKAANDVLPLSFWEIPATEFSADTPVIMRSPINDDTTASYIWWTFSFKYVHSTDLLIKHYESELRHLQNPEEKAAITRRIEIIKKGSVNLEPRVRLHASMHANTGKSSYNLSLPIIRNIAEKKRGIRLETIDEIRARNLTPGEVVHGVAIFPEVDSFADAFEIRVMGLGKRFRPSYDPGQLFFSNEQYGANLRKCMRFFYTRPGDETARERDNIYFDRRSQEWLWLWYMDLYPTAPVALQELTRTIEVSKGENKELKLTYAYVPYTVLNSTRTAQPFTVEAAGVFLSVKWNDMPLMIDMLDDQTTDFWKIKAMRKIREAHPNLLPKEGEPYHADGEVVPGAEKGLKGVAVFKWGLSSPALAMREMVKQVHARGFSPAKSDEENPLVKAYRALMKQESDDTKIWNRPELPSNEQVQALILKQAEEDVKTYGITIGETEKQQFGDLAAFTCLMNYLAKQKLDQLQAKENSIVPLHMIARWNGISDEVRVVRRYNIKLDEVGRSITDMNMISTELGTFTTPAGQNGTGTGTEAPPADIDNMW